MSDLARFNSYDPQCWAWLRKQGGFAAQPPECSKCGWLHDPREECAALCWCGDVHPVSKTHERSPEVQARMDARLTEEPK